MQYNGEVITSRQNRTVVEVGKLTDRREREKTECFRFDGIKLACEAVKNHLQMPLIFLRESNFETIKNQLEKSCGQPLGSIAERTLILSDGVFDKISEEKSPEGIICVAKYLDKCKKIATIYSDGKIPPFSESLVLVESVRDPSNIGAIIRSASALGVDRLIISEDCADVYNAKAVRASMGTLFGQSIDRVGNLSAVIGQLRATGRTVYSAALDESAEKLGSFKPEKGDCVVIGNEGHGLSQDVLLATDRKVYIPMSDRAESFNAAVAASILMWEFRKK